ncbi:hypothetical protein H0O00_02120 [Candidatus Micrarchaeota archaeon]|nr:hypothetical protein [Candidatus Micrarchaeota archaeon]
MDKKGFLFTVTVFLILMYILLSISVWVKAIESSERAFSEFYKESTIELTIEQITPDKMHDTAHVIMNRNLQRLNTQAEEYAVKAGLPEDENSHVRAALLEMLANGSAASEHFDGGAALPEKESSFKAWVADLNDSLRAIGVYVSGFEISGFQVGQSAMDKVNYSFNLTLELKDLTNTSSVSRTYEISDELSITGLVDPALSRESREAKANGTIYRQFFFDKTDYAESAPMVGEIKQTVTGGQGWLYAPLASAGASATHVPLGKHIFSPDRKDYILVGTYDEMEALTPLVYDDFAGYILTSAPVTAKTKCGSGKLDESKTFNPISYSDKCEIGTDAPVVSKPFIVAPKFNLSKAPECPLLNETGATGRCVLMINSYSEAEVGSDPSKKNAEPSKRGLYDVEDIRTFVMCGFYTHNAKAPSYLQRLLPDPYTRNSTDYGIETFVIGNYANDYDVYDTHSRLDRELFNDLVAEKVRGLPGCKSSGACASDPQPVTGVFAVREGTKDDYGLGQIWCDNGAAGCDE